MPYSFWCLVLVVWVRPHPNTHEVHLHIMTNQMTYEPSLWLCSNSRNSVRKLKFLMFYIYSDCLLPAPDRRYSITFWHFLAKAKVSLQKENGPCREINDAYDVAITFYALTHHVYHPRLAVLFVYQWCLRRGADYRNTSDQFQNF